MNTPTVVVLIVVGVVGVIALLMVVRARASSDGVDSFRRQIDALSPEARKPVVDQVQNAAGRVNPGDQPDGVDADDIDEDGARGT